MIMILGTTYDDVLYYESIMTNKREEVVLNRYPVHIGTIFNQDVLICTGIYTSYIANTIVSAILEKYFIVLCFVVGKCTSFSDDLNIGDIIVSRRTYLSDVDLTTESNAVLGQIPGYPEYYQTSKDIIDYLMKAIDKRTLVPHKIGVLISGSCGYNEDNQISQFKNGSELFGESTNVAFDFISGGVAVTCYLHKCPFVCAKVVAKKFKTDYDAKDYAVVLHNYIELGKGIITCIGDVGHNNVIRGLE